MTNDTPPPRPAPEPDDPHARAVLDAGEISRAITRMAHEIIETNHGSERLLLLGIPTRGVPLAERLALAIDKAADQPEGTTPVGQLDITMYRDDLRKHPTRAVGRTHLPERIDGATVVLVDDVLFSGRTVSAALDALKDIGRPVAVRLAVLVDRGHRELPIRADHVGKNLPTSASERVKVSVEEIDGRSEVTISRPAAPASERKNTR
ncbi:MAG TPA: bifunctional pyr operon transcriptional regulator/uracil phosphoribosyltransferase PyrR [Propionibacterium sp.]|jgi:pyrimidine operon attenuation protein/uracil phosphoribosyltransferase|nr:bifunctional pyr operon transcriptional regulator/uracil phosphoribosyltransferase PyrR [Propionibacterium sp.]